jgi:cytidine deaminase
MAMAFERVDDPAWQPLVDAAWEARSHAHAPYSGFRVGAALRTVSGETIGGCNVENASYPVSVCAERTAIGTAVARGMVDGGLAALVVVTEAETLTPPCGACRQVIAEFAADAPVLLVNRSGRALHRLAALLPEAFTGRSFRPVRPESPPAQALSKADPSA